MDYRDAAKKIIHWAKNHFWCSCCLHDDEKEEVRSFPAFFDEVMENAKSSYTFAEFERDLHGVKRLLDEDLEAAYHGDPAASSKEEIIVAYPGFYAIFVHRIAHVLYQRKVQILPRVMSELAHSSTGIDIHPGATIGHRIFIDHGTGVVIGETAEIGDNVRIYQGVTIGAKSLEHADKLRGVKRHPTIKNNVIIYAGASILGGDTVIGNNVIVGSNVFITFSIEDNKVVRFRSKDYEIVDKPAN